MLLFVSPAACNVCISHAHTTVATVSCFKLPPCSCSQGNLHIIDYSNSPFARPDIRILIEGAICSGRCAEPLFAVVSHRLGHAVPVGSHPASLM